LNFDRRRFLAGAAAAAAAAALPDPGVADAQLRQPVAAERNPQAVNIRVDAAVKHTMAGGIGASWQAIGPTGFFYPDAVRSNGNQRRARGSGWGGTPLVRYKQQWEDLRRHFRWLGLDFVRVEIDMRMYAPERGRFDWENEEMQMLYAILDTCQQNGADVFFTEMWQDVDWNAFPEVGRLKSAPKSVPDFAHCLGALMQHLIREKQYTCIRWLCMTNEPADTWGWWLGPDHRPQSLMPAVHAVRAELDRRGLSSLAISGPDSIDSDDFNSAQFNWNDPAVGAFDVHYYTNQAMPPVSMDWMQPLVARARRRGVPIFLSEFGSNIGGDPENDPTTPACASYSNQLLNAEKVLLGLNLGVDGFNRWSFTNRGDLDGQWQLVDTWNPVYWSYLPRVEPKPVPYYTYGILTRFVAKHSKVLTIDARGEGIFAAALQSKGGKITVLVLNKSSRAAKMTLELPANGAEPAYSKDQVTRAAVETAQFEMSPVKTFSVSTENHSIADDLPAESIAAYSNFHLKSSDPGVIEE
jgi:hypothetical protein